MLDADILIISTALQPTERIIDKLAPVKSAPKIKIPGQIGPLQNNLWSYRPLVILFMVKSIL